MASNSFTVKVNFVSNNQTYTIEGRKGEKIDYHGYVLYNFVDGLNNSQKWFVTWDDGLIEEFNSISSIVKKYREHNISGACQKKENSAVCISEGKHAGKYFYSVLPLTGSSACSMPSKEPKKIVIDWNKEEKNSISLEEAFEKSKKFKDYFDKYNGGD